MCVCYGEFYETFATKMHRPYTITTHSRTRSCTLVATIIGPGYVHTFHAQFNKHFLLHRLEQGFKDNLHIEYKQL